MRRYVKLGLCALGYWVFDALIHSLLLSGGALPQELFRPTAKEVYARAIVIFALGAGLIFRDLHFQARRAREKDLETFRGQEVVYRTIFDELGEGLALRQFVYDEQGQPTDYRFIDVNPAFVSLTGTTKEVLLGGTGRAQFPEVTESLLPKFLKAHRAGGISQFEHYIPDIDKHLAYTLFPLGEDTFGTLAVDVSQYKLREGVLRQIVSTESLVNQILKELVSKGARGLSEVLGVLAKHMDVHRCSLFWLRDQRVVHHVETWADEPEVAASCPLLGMDLSLLRPWYRALLRGKTVYVSDLDDEPSLQPLKGWPCGDEPPRAWAAAPVMLDGSLFGVLNLCTPEKHEWTPEELALLGTVSQVMAAHQRRARAEAKMEHLTYRDSLTNLYNRTYFYHKLLPKIVGEPVLSLVMGDIDGLKMTNDTLGHGEGDRLIAAASRAMACAAGQGDSVVRWGGDEFILVMPGADESRAKEVCRHIKRGCRVNQEGIKVSLSLGHASRTTRNIPISDLIKRAEDLMYLNKPDEGWNSRHALVTTAKLLLLKDSRETEDHCRRVQNLSMAVGRALGMKQESLRRLGLLACLHDIGKVGVPERVLDKPGGLTPEEWTLMKAHPETGYRIAKAVGGELGTIAEGILSHHERWDGTGYPRGISGESIPLMARIVAIADAFDAMTSDRPYRKAMSAAQAMNELHRSAGSQLDPALVAVFERVIESGSIQSVRKMTGYGA